MNWIAGLQRAIDFIELNLEGKVSLEDVARCSGCSSFYFQRLFSMLAGYSVGEYIRKRRLSKAAEELVSKQVKIIDVALKYGYDTPESFSRAFRAFHGCLPSQVRNASSIKSFSRIQTKLVIEGGKDMDYRIVNAGPFKVLEKARYFTNGEQSLKEVPAFWDSSWKDGTCETLFSHMGGDNELKSCLLGICYDGDDCSKFKYSIAVTVDDLASVPEGFEVSTIPSQTWVVFKSQGKLPKCIQETTRMAYTQFFPSSEYQPNGLYDLEVYPESIDSESGEGACWLWISAERRY